jgi:hypothetical protein
MDAAGIIEGPLFRPVLHGGRVQPTTMSDDAAVWAIKRRRRRRGTASGGVMRTWDSTMGPHRDAFRDPRRRRGP